MRTFVIGVVACATLAVAHAQEPAPPRTVLLFVDTLHIQFRDTPQLRLGLHEGIERLLNAGRAVALATSADARIAVPSTDDAPRYRPPLIG